MYAGFLGVGARGGGDIGSSSIIDPTGLAQKCLFFIIASFFERDIFERDIFEKDIFSKRQNHKKEKKN